MVVVLSGEGPTDLGVSESGADRSEELDFLPGPMAWMADHVIASKYNYSVRAGKEITSRFVEQGTGLQRHCSLRKFFPNRSVGCGGTF